MNFIKSIFNKINKFIAIPIIAILVIPFAFIYFTNVNKELSYSISPIEKLTNFSSLKSNLKIFWNDKIIDKDLKKVNILVWNSGNEFIDFKDFSKDIKFKIDLPNNIELIDFEIIKKSRDTLDFFVSYDIDKRQIIFDFSKKDDAFEENEGFKLSLLYIGGDDTEFNFNGRIKGISKKFNNVDWNKTTFPMDITLFVLILFTSVTFIIIILLIITRNYLTLFLGFICASMYFGLSFGLLHGFWGYFFYNLEWMN